MRALYQGGAESGDVILFRTAAAALPLVQRAVTGSPWDHVGILLYRDQHKRVCTAAESTDVGVIECDATNGTRYSPMRRFESEWHRLYAQVAIRPLLWPGRGSAEACDLLNRWSLEVQGTPYALSIGKLLAARAPAAAPLVESSLDAARGGGIPEAPPAGFFCSELAAHCYKAIGVLPAARPAAGYWPGDFGEGKRLPLVQGADLGKEVPLVFKSADDIGELGLCLSITPGSQRWSEAVHSIS